MSRATEWLDAAPIRLATVLRRLTWHRAVNWNAPDYIGNEEFPEGDDGRRITSDVDEVEALSSLKSAYSDEPDGCRFHALLVDIDVPAWLVPSSTEGHGHLYVDLHIPEADLWEFLDAAVKIGLVEEGYVSACKSRGMTSLRAPWVKKGEEPRPPLPPPVDESGEPTHVPCCSSHGEPMTCARYRRTHFVESRPCCSIDAATLAARPAL